MSEKRDISSETVRAQDEDLAVKPINPLIDYSLGGLFMMLCGKLAVECVKDQTMGITFLICLVAVIFIIHATQRIAQVVGRQLSKFRTYDGIPESAKDPLKKKLPMRKFKDQSWQFVIHTSMTIYGVYLLRDNDWWENPATTFEPCPLTFLGKNPENRHSFELRLFYLVQLAIWIWTCFSCQFLESRRKDYLEMMLHHIFTITLVLYSFLNGELAIGLVILVVHDGTDIIADTLKIVNYLKLTDAHGFFIVELAFVSNMVAWAYYRLYKFPTDVVYNGLLNGYAANCGVVEGGAIERCASAGSCLSSFILLSSLCVLHVYWFCLFIRILIKILNGDTSRAGKEEYEGTSGSERCTSDDEGREKLKSS